MFKVTNTGKTFSNVFISLELTKNDIESLPIKITSKKVSKSNVYISTRQITSKKVRGNNDDFSTIEITWIKVSGSNVDFSTIEITSKKVGGNHVDFSTSEITSKKYTEMTWKFIEIWSSTYQRNIHVESTSIRRGVPVGKLQFFKFQTTF